MKSIKELLKRMNESERYKKEGSYSMRIFYDGSGAILNDKDAIVFFWGNSDGMSRVLDKIDNFLKESEPSNNWQL